jgi:uncharacterized oxidoreductase
MDQLERKTMRLTGRTILITGGSAGIGLAFANKLESLGNEVIVTGRRQSALDSVRTANPRIHTIQSDVADPKQISTLAEHVKQKFPKIDVLINNAGISLYKNLAHTSSDLDALAVELNTNAGGVIRMTSAFIDVLRANRGTLINVSSALAFVPLPCIPIYCASKAAIHSYTQSLRFQLEDSGVEVIELMPPAVKTDMTAELPEKDMKMISTDELVDQSILGLASGAPEILVGQAKQLALMRRIAPSFINAQLWKAAKRLVPLDA